MTTQVNTSASLLIDTEFASISYSEATLRLQELLLIRRTTTPFSALETRTFRTLFYRPRTAFRLRSLAL